MSFVFSADGHIVEPSNLFSESLPVSLRQHGLRTEHREGFMYMMAGDKITSKKSLQKAKPRLGPDGESFGRAERRGAREIPGRLLDMAEEGIDAEIVFPSLGLTAFLIENPDAELATAQAYNDWLQGLLSPHPDKFVRCGILPVRDFGHTVAEIKRLAKLGFTAAMLPSLIEQNSGLPFYNDEAWDPVFEAGQGNGIVFVLHTGTGRDDVRSHKGPGGAVINYTIQACDGMQTILHMVAGGVLDRFPDTRVCCIEGGASWLAALAERMDEVYSAHEMFVKPKLSVTPREVIARQVACSFQTDRACIMSRTVTGARALMWGSDYPHHEGTFPHSRQVLAHLFDGIDISEQDKADIVGGNAARLFKLRGLEIQRTA
jgi:predicted TIM-barrel fold metal-dependent hydrolase